MRSAYFAFFTLTAFFAFASAARPDEAKPIRHLVYNFDITLSSALAQETGSGTYHSSGGTGDRGQIVADIIAVQPDTGLVVRISENARETRSAEPAMCVTYGDGQLICENDKKINEEEYTLLRLLGKGFVNRSEIDAKNHWTFSTNSEAMNETSDFTINSESNGVLRIGLLREQRVKGAQGFTATTHGNLLYNERLSVPVSDTEDTVTRTQSGMSYDNLEQQITLNLATDSMQQRAAQGH